MKKRLLRTGMIMIIVSLLAACSKPHLVGIILEVNDDEVVVSENLSFEKYNEISNKSISEIQKAEKGIPLIVLSYKNTEKFARGDKVNVWIKGEIRLTYPSKAKASKITLHK